MENARSAVPDVQRAAKKEGQEIPLWLVLFCDRVESSIIIPKSLAKREIKCLNARIKEFDLEGSVYDWTFLPDELIKPGLPNFTGAVRGSVNSAIFPRSGAVQGHLKANGLSVLRRS